MRGAGMGSALPPGGGRREGEGRESKKRSLGQT